jgi:acetate kinase
VSRVFLLNAGSSSLKCTVIDSTTRQVLARASADWAGTMTRYERTGPGADQVIEQGTLQGHGDAARRMLDDLELKPRARATTEPLAAIGHRIVHGGRFRSSVRVTSEVRSRIAALAELAPLHNPPGLAALDTAEKLLPNVPQVAVFDTSFHATLPPVAHTYPVPNAWSSEWGIRRYGFHGLSYAYCAGRAAVVLDRDPIGLRLVVCHLGHGCSATAIADGRSIDTTMGFTPLDGLMMGTRSGSVDPGVLTHVQRRHGLDAEDLDDALNYHSGLLGVSNLSSDMREVLAAASAGNRQAQLAIDVYAHRVRQAIGALTVTLGGVDAVVFTGGVGEHAAEIRAAACRGLECIGVELDANANARCRPDADIALPQSRVRVLVLTTREDLAMLSEVMGVISTQPGAR